jgi:hypothetical protein
LRDVLSTSWTCRGVTGPGAPHTTSSTWFSSSPLPSRFTTCRVRPGHADEADKALLGESQ